MAIEEKATTAPVLGVDVSKRRLDAALTKECGGFAGSAFENTAAGRRALFAWVRKLGAVRCDLCLEPSGGYEAELCEEAHRRGHRVLLANAMRTASFRKSLHLRNKTDWDDARMLCQFALRMPVGEWTPPSPQVRRLRELVALRQHAVKGARERKANGDDRRVNKARAKVRARVEHVFGSIKNELHGDAVRSIGLARAEVRVCLTMIGYNLRRWTFLARPPPRTG